jgi:exonuclease III
MPCDGPHGGLAPGEAVLRVGTWNMSHWTAEKVAMVAENIAVDILALQETHLAQVPVEVAHTTARCAGLHLHHGRPVAARPHSEHGRSCGVGFLCRQGIPLALATPSCPSWSMLHTMCRLHAVQLAPRQGLPRGLLLISVYAPLRGHGQDVVRARFDLAMMELVHALDMQVPTLLVGDFNGSACPSRDFQSASGSRRAACPLLAQLLGPGAPWVDVQVALGALPLSWTFQAVDSHGKVSASRIDLILANHVALNLIRTATVQDEIHHGGHSPVVVELVLHSGVINWQPPALSCPLCCSDPPLSCSPCRCGQTSSPGGRPQPPPRTPWTHGDPTAWSPFLVPYTKPSSTWWTSPGVGLHAPPFAVLPMTLLSCAMPGECCQPCTAFGCCWIGPLSCSQCAGLRHGRCCCICCGGKECSYHRRQSRT